jgi:nucleoside-diphosphate-sugar epimerase
VAAAAFLAATRPEALGRAINVVDGHETTLDEFYRFLAGACLPGKALRTINLPGWLGRGVGRVVSLTSNLLGLDHPFMDPSHYAAHHAGSNLVFSNARMLELFAKGGHSLVSLEEGIRELAENSSSVMGR